MTSRESSGFPCRLLVLDIDGTLLNERKEITPAVRAAVAEAVAAGLPTAFATGRMFEAVRHWVGAFGFTTPQICNNGAEIVEPSGRRLDRCSLGAATVRRLLDWARGHDFAVVQFAGGRVLAARDHPAHILLERNHEHVEVVPRAEFEHAAGEVEKLLYMTLDPAVDLRALGVELSRRAATDPGVEFVAQISEEGILNFCHPEATKRNAVRKLCARLGCTTDEVIAVGDGDNDAEILGAVGLGIAMGNASEAAVRAAKIQVPDNEHDGLAVAIREIALPRAAAAVRPDLLRAGEKT